MPIPSLPRGAVDAGRARLVSRVERERRQWRDTHPRAAAADRAGAAHLLGGVPMTWMRMWPGGFPPYLDSAHGNRVRDIDGHEYVDFCLGDTGAMAGHSPEPTVRAVTARLAERGGLTAMLPTTEAAEVGAELAGRFGLPQWSFSLTATDANRWALRLARHVTRRPRVLVFSYGYHGTVDETFVVLDGGRPRSRAGNVGPAVDPTTTTRVVEFNDVEAVERELAADDVAVVLTEPALTNIGIVLPEPGFHEALRELTRRHGTLLAIDETHTFSAGWGGCTRAWGLQPDIVTLGKAIGGGVPTGAYGLSAELATRVLAAADADIVDVGGVGGTLAGNALSSAAMHATLGRVLTQDTFAHMCRLGERYEHLVRALIDGVGLPWSVTRLGARVEFRYSSPAPRSGGESAAAADPILDEFLHLYAANRGFLLTPFHNMALMCPATTEGDVDAFGEVLAAALRELTVR